MLLMVYVDDAPGELVAYVTEELFKRGALNVHVVPSITKKGRPGLILFIDVEEELLGEVAEVLARDLGSLGFRILECRHESVEYKVDYIEVRVKGEVKERVRVKKIVRGSEVLSVKAEFEDLKRLVQNTNKMGVRICLANLKKLVEAAALEGRAHVDL